MLVPTVFAVRFFATEKGRLILDQYVWKVPAMGTLLHKTSIEIFCRVFYALYSGAGENIEVIRLAAEACGNKYMEHKIKTVALPLMIQKGAGITEAFEATGVFTKTAISRFHSGAETGTVKTHRSPARGVLREGDDLQDEECDRLHPVDDLHDHHDRLDGPHDRIV